MLPEFPPTGAPPMLSAALRGHGISLRPAAADDLPFLHDLYASLRAPELALAPWSPAQKRAFTDDQFRLQHGHFVRHHAAADFWIVMQALPLAVPRPIGRLYLDRSGPEWLIVDIGLLAELQGRGLGSAILAWIQSAAPAVALQVAANNPRAHALYARLGFRNAGQCSATHQPMAWRAPVS